MLWFTLIGGCVGSMPLCSGVKMTALISQGNRGEMGSWVAVGGLGGWRDGGLEERRPVITSESSADRQRGKHTHALGLGQCRGTTISHTDTVKDIAHTETDSDSDIIIVKK